MKTFYIDVWEEMSGTLTIEAKNKEEAKKIAEEQINMYGVGCDNERVKGAGDFNISHRDVQLI